MAQPKSLTHLTLLEKKELRRAKVYQNLCETYGVKSLTDIQFRYLEKGIRYQGIFDIETADFDLIDGVLAGKSLSYSPIRISLKSCA